MKTVIASVLVVVAFFRAANSQTYYYSSTLLATPLATPAVEPLMVTPSVSGGAQIAGEDYTLTCTVTGGGITSFIYRWWKDGTLLTGQTANTIAFRPLQQTSSGVYICEGTRNSTAVNSTSVTLTVQGESKYSELKAFKCVHYQTQHCQLS